MQFCGKRSIKIVAGIGTHDMLYHYIDKLQCSISFEQNLKSQEYLVTRASITETEAPTFPQS